MVAAAVAAVVRDGVDVPMATIAAEAGVGIATLYRKYPSRTAMLLALTERSFELLADRAEHVGAQQGTGFALLDRWWDELIEISDQLVLPLRGGPAVFTDAAAAARQRLHAQLRAMLRAGRRDGTLRRDITLDDVITFGTMLATPFYGADRRRVARRQKQLHLDGMSRNGGS